MFLNFDLCIIAFLKALEIKGLLLNLRIFFLNGNIFVEDCNKDILKIGEINCIITFKTLIQFYIERVVIPI